MIRNDIFHVQINENEDFSNSEAFCEKVMEGYKDYHEGRTVSGESVFEEIRRKYGIST